MSGLLAGIDRTLFVWVNSGLSNPVTDVVMPALTDWNQHVVGLCIAVALVCWFFWKEKRKAFVLVVAIALVILTSDQFSSFVVKPFVQRPRPCHDPVTVPLHLLVSCGSGYSFPSSHAVNNFALGVFLSHYYRRFRWVFLTYAFLMAISRVFVGVHYPSDVIGGALIGSGVAFLWIAIVRAAGKRFSFLFVEPESSVSWGMG